MELANDAWKLRACAGEVPSGSIVPQVYTLYGGEACQRSYLCGAKKREIKAAPVISDRLFDDAWIYAPPPPPPALLCSKKNPYDSSPGSLAALQSYLSAPPSSLEAARWRVVSASGRPCNGNTRLQPPTHPSTWKVDVNVKPVRRRSGGSPEFSARLRAAHVKGGRSLEDVPVHPRPVGPGRSPTRSVSGPRIPSNRSCSVSA
ncbi:unnamed protein product [Pleuronectes platessa]|uniref:Uncharacterized protein n=1 Tax=Pleuronectes platessa TaxID=8262 RepID=A0A9N7W472_PLEPL|nr:unnamed protein product [Pleuronectes platessa]